MIHHAIKSRNAFVSQPACPVPGIFVPGEPFSDLDLSRVGGGNSLHPVQFLLPLGYQVHQHCIMESKGYGLDQSRLIEMREVSPRMPRGWRGRKGRRDAGAPRILRRKLDVKHPPGHDAPFARTGNAGVLDAVLKVKEHAGLNARVALIYQHGASAQKVSVPLEGEVDGGIKQRMSWADKGG
jgi:hypothetical protein